MRIHISSIISGYTVVALLAAFVGSAVQVTPVYAASIVVTSNADVIANDGLCTLREALMAAQQDAPQGGCAGGSGPDTISFAGNYTITVGDELPTVTTPIEITGKGMANTVIQAAVTPNTATWRVFQVAPAGNLTLDQLTVRNGQCDGSCTVEPDAGGGIYNGGILTITDSLISGNSGSLGGGISNSGTLTVTSSTISDNDAFLVGIDHNGGGIRNNGTLTVTDSTISGNQASSGGGISNSGTLTVTNTTISANSALLFPFGSSGDGGGIFHRAGTATVTNSTITENQAEQSGGGISNGGATMLVTDSTIAGNSAAGVGGGIDNIGSGLTIINSTISGNRAGLGGGVSNSGTLTVTNTTISDNFVSHSGGGLSNDNGNLTVTNSTISGNKTSDFSLESGGGISNQNGNLTVTNSTISGNNAKEAGGIFSSDFSFDGTDTTILRNSIVAKNNGGNCGVMTTTITDGGGNLSWPDTSCPGINADPLLGSLADNGGPTETVALLSGSPAIDAAKDVNCPETDQRGGDRPQGSHCDIGAYEFGATIIIPPTFADVPESYWAWDFIERLYAAGITGGCATSPLSYCPEATVTRAQMAVFLLRGIHGASYAPPDLGAGSGFGDVLPDYWAASFIKQLAAEGITAGCGGGNFCPEQPVTRAQMAVFLLRSNHGASYIPPSVGAGTGFGDVPPDYWAAAWIKQLVTESITAGCGGANYCPESPVTRAQMAVFLVRTFNLP